MRAVLLLLVACLLVGCTLATSTPGLAPVAPAATPTVGEVSQLPTTTRESVSVASVLASSPVPTQTQSTPNASAPALALDNSIQGIPAALTPTANTRAVTVIVDRTVNLRGGPTTDAEIIAVLAPGTAVRTADVDAIITGDPSHWVPVTYDDRNGYIRADLLSPSGTKSAQGK